MDNEREKDRKKLQYLIKCLLFLGAYFFIGDWVLGKLNEYANTTFNIIPSIIGAFVFHFIFGIVFRFEKIRSLFNKRKTLVISWPDIILALLPLGALLINVFMPWGWRHLSPLGLMSGYFAAGIIYRISKEE